MTRILLFFGILFLFGCGTYPARSIDLIIKKEWVDGVSTPRVVTVGGNIIESHHIHAISEAMQYLPGKFFDLNLIFYIRDDEGHFFGAGAHAHYLPINLICFTPAEAKVKYVWHEVAHAYDHHLGLTKGQAGFYKKWRDISNGGYGADRTYGVRDGFLTNYSRKGPNEDVADFFQECRWYLHKERNYHLFKHNSNLKDDDRYAVNSPYFIKPDSSPSRSMIS